MKFSDFVGVDTSKNTLDICLIRNKVQLHQACIKNSPKEIKSFFTFLKKKFGLDPKQTLCCMEHTGIYNYKLLEYLSTFGFNIWVERAVQIKFSLGMMRGKSDKLDATRIAMYAYKNSEEYNEWYPERTIIKKLKQLIVTRNRFINAQKQLSVPLKESKGFMEKDLIKMSEILNKKPLLEIKNTLLKIEKEIKSTIQQDEHLARLFALVKSVDGVGDIIACNVIIKTNEFKSFSEANKFACHCGVVPFEHKSGTSIRGKTKVSHMANKSLKALFHMAAMAVIRQNGELKEYYKRKVEQGKNKMSVINAIRNKLIARIFAVVKRNEPYQKNFQYSLA